MLTLRISQNPRRLRLTDLHSCSDASPDKTKRVQLCWPPQERSCEPAVLSPDNRPYRKLTFHQRARTVLLDFPRSWGVASGRGTLGAMHAGLHHSCNNKLGTHTVAAGSSSDSVYNSALKSQECFRVHNSTSAGTSPASKRTCPVWAAFTRHWTSCVALTSELCYQFLCVGGLRGVRCARRGSSLEIPIEKEEP